MKKTVSTFVGRAALFASVGLAAVALSTPAVAQDSGDDEAEEEVASDTAATDDTAIVVTGSRIRRDEFSTIEPLTIIGKEEVTQAGFASATDALQSNAVTAGSGQINNIFGGFVTDGGTGANTLGLRNLGPSRTLVLLNGRRLAPGGTRGSVLAADLNVLPTAILEQIEVLQAGASSVYGSDAVAGVVNIITDTSIRGLSLEAQVNIPEIGAGFDRRVAATFGFGDDRLNVIGSLEYRKRNAIARNDQPWLSCPIPGTLDGEGSEFGSGDVPGFDGTTCFTLDSGGVTINTLGVPSRAAQSRTDLSVVSNFTRLVPDSRATGALPGFAGVTLNSRDTFNPIQEEEELVTPVETYTGFAQASYELDSLGNAEIYGEVLVNRRKSSSKLFRQFSLDYLQGSPLLPEPFRSDTRRFLAPNETSGGRNVGARAFIGFGLTDSFQTVDYARAGGGIRGDFFLPDWRYDAYVGKAWNDGTYEIESFLIDRVAASLDVVDNGDGTFRCASSNINRNCVAAPALTAAVIGGDLPQNYRDYILQNTIGTTSFRETTYAFNVDGPVFTLPGGDAQIALGAEYRKQSINDVPDANSINGNLLGLTASVPTIGSDNVKEIFGEVYLPLLSDLPFADSVILNGSVRYTDYDSYGSDVTYKIAGEWAFFPGVGIRGSYGTSYRAPALSEQFLGATSGFAGAGGDPCDGDNFPANLADYDALDTIVAANCASIGIDVTTFQQNSSLTVNRLGGAETGLAAETSTNWGVGAVIRQDISATTSIALALDYFDIEVENGVATLGSGAILSRCYQDVNFDPDEGFCRFVERDANQRVTVNSGFVNLSTDIVRGFEFTSRLSTEVLGGQFVLNADVTKYEEQSTRLFPEEFLFDANGTTAGGGAGRGFRPEWVGNFDATFRLDNVTFRYGLDWTGGSSGSYEAFAFDNETGTSDPDTVQFFRDTFVLEVDDYFLHNTSIQFDIQEKFQLTMGVRNLLNTEPPLVSAAIAGIGNAPLYSGYDFVGRQYFVNTAFKF